MNMIILPLIFLHEQTVELSPEHFFLCAGAFGRVGEQILHERKILQERIIQKNCI